MPRPLPRARSLAVLACLAAAVPALATSTAAGASSVTAHAAATTCKGFPMSKPTYHGHGGYFNSLKVSGLGCKSGKTVMRDHNACRVHKGLTAYCRRVDGYRCSERRGDAIPTEFSSRVTCTKGSKKVIYVYQQDT